MNFISGFIWAELLLQGFKDVMRIFYAVRFWKLSQHVTLIST